MIGGNTVAPAMPNGWAALGEALHVIRDIDEYSKRWDNLDALVKAAGGAEQIDRLRADLEAAKTAADKLKAEAEEALINARLRGAQVVEQARLDADKMRQEAASFLADAQREKDAAKDDAAKRNARCLARERDAEAAEAAAVQHAAAVAADRIALDKREAELNEREAAIEAWRGKMAAAGIQVPAR